MVCKSGKCAEQGRQLLAASGFTSVEILDGGMDAWQAAKKPVVVAERPPWSSSVRCVPLRGPSFSSRSG